ncbi:MAG: DMT family transporter [Desulfomonilia bacterium]|jgi:drug/metabolite transporter (DMT)-like permease|nr:DMT family transporter [Deltaproteobacteria bacterium]MDX9761854.1 DMT family transporter [Desulfomonilia bacterium]
MKPPAGLINGMILDEKTRQRLTPSGSWRIGLNTKPEPHISQKPAAGALNILGAALMFAMLGALVRLASSTLPNEVVVFFRNIFALVFLMPILLYRRTGVSLHPPRSMVPLHLFRAATGLSAMYCYFYSLAHLKLAEAVLLSYTSPLFIPIIAFLWLREPMDRRVIRAVVIGFAGVLLILKPGVGIFQPVSLIALLAAVLASLAMVSIRRMSFSEPPGRIVFYYTLFSTLISAMPLSWAWQTPGRPAFLVLLLVGVVAVAGQIFMTRGYSLAPASVVVPFIYAAVIFAAIIGWIFWDESLDALTAAGAVLICSAGVIAARIQTPEQS